MNQKARFLFDQIEMAAAAGVSGTLQEWPMLRRAIECFAVLPHAPCSMPGMEARQICRAWLKQTGEEQAVSIFEELAASRKHVKEIGVAQAYEELDYRQRKRVAKTFVSSMDMLGEQPGWFYECASDMAKKPSIVADWFTSPPWADVLTNIIAAARIPQAKFYHEEERE